MWLIQGGAEVARHWRQHVKQAVTNDVCDTQYIANLQKFVLN